MKIKFLFFASLLAVMASCGGDDFDCENNNLLNTTLNTATQTINTAITTFNASPQSTADCETFQEAYDDYIESLEEVSACAGTNANELLTAARTARNTLTCN